MQRRGVGFGRRPNSLAGCLGKWADLRNRMERMHVTSASRGAKDDGRAFPNAIDDEIHDSG